MPAFPDPAPFLAHARTHMRGWVREALGIEPTDDVSVTLSREHAARGQNFYGQLGVVEAVLERFPQTFSRSMGPGSRAGDALCSAHAPFNLFAPLRRCDSGKVARMLSELVAAPIDNVDSIAFEQPSSRRDNPLGDNTAFDCLISGRSGALRVSAGIEVKFTEGPYAWGALERRRMLDPASKYNKSTASGGLFRSESATELRGREFKQLWRNMLLAQLSGDPSHRCYYVHLYPKQNVHQGAVASAFRGLLTSDGAARFRPVTYENYVDLLEETGFDPKWMLYLRRRYLVCDA